MRQNDSRLRVVSFRNLVEMCDRASGSAHNYRAELTASRCTLTYSNPDEWGASRPYSVRLPLLRSDDRENPDVLLHVMSELGGGDDRESCFQAIDSAIFQAPELWRGLSEWGTRFELDSRMAQMPRGRFRAESKLEAGKESLAVWDGYGAVVALVPLNSAMTTTAAQWVAERIARALDAGAERDGMPSADAERAAAGFKAELERAEARRVEVAALRFHASEWLVVSNGAIRWDATAKLAAAAGRDDIAARIAAMLNQAEG